MSSVDVSPLSRNAVYSRDILWALGTSVLAAATYLYTHGDVSAFALCGIPIAIILCVKAPLQICTFFVAFSFFRLHEAYPFLGEFKIPLVLGILMFTAIILHLVVLQSIKPFMTVELKRLAVMFMIVLVGVAFAQDRDVAWQYVSEVYWKILLMTFVIAWLAKTDRDYKFIARTLIVSGDLIAAVAIYNKIYGISLVEGTRVSIGRVSVPAMSQQTDQVDPNFVASVLSDPPLNAPDPI